MREILFRGKCFNTEEWVEGYLGIEVPDELVIQQFSFDDYFNSDCIDQHRVKPETVGQYTGLKDLHGTRIFEGDVVKDITPLYKGLTPRDREKMLKERAKKRGIAIVRFGYHDVKADDPFCVGRAYGVYFEGETEFTTPAQYYGYGDWQENENYQFEVIGNIWDNPELLWGEK